MVDISGGTLSQNVTLNVLGSGMTQYQLDSNLTIAAGVQLTLNAGTRLYVSQTSAVIVNGSLAINNAAWVQQHYYNGNQSGFVVNSGGNDYRSPTRRSLGLAMATQARPTSP